MISLQFPQQKELTRHIFTSETFDSFLVKEADFKTFCHIQIDGNYLSEYFTEQADATSLTLCPWLLLRGHAFSLIKGSRLPQSFHIVFYMDIAKAADFFKVETLSSNDDIGGFYFNITYKNQQLQATTGSSMKNFTLDREADTCWDETIKKWLNTQEIPYEY